MIDSNVLNPSWTITIQPLMTGGDGSAKGNYLLLTNGNSPGNTNGTTKINKIIFDINGTANTQTMILQSDNGDVSANYTQVVLDMPLNIDFSIFNPLSTASLMFRLKNSSISYSGGSDNAPNFTDPILDIFRGGDIMTISLYNSLAPNIIQTVFTGRIERSQIISTNQGTTIPISLGGYSNILAQSMLVNNSEEQNIQGTLANEMSQPLQLGDLISQLVDETYLATLGVGIDFYGGITNSQSEVVSTSKVSVVKDANGEVSSISASSGSALIYDSWLFVSTPPTSNKMQTILQAIYPYQRVFYVDLVGRLVITPLQAYFDSDEAWNFDIAGLATDENGNLDTTSYVPIMGMSRSSNTAIISNRVLCTLAQALVQFKLVSGSSTNQATVPQSIITPPKAFFPRAYEMVASQLGMQTIINVQSVDSDSICYNAGLLNTMLFISQGNSIPGLQTPYPIDGNQASLQVKGSNTVFEPIKYCTASYGLRSLAESLKDDMLIEITIPIKYTYLPSKNTFRTIPINQLVILPPTSNNVFDGLRQYFCYGFKIQLDKDQNGASFQLLTLRLCKPYTYTGLWCDKIELIDSADL
jgi:hypothetical protein